jgi:outer membrane protein insertion porin family
MGVALGMLALGLSACGQIIAKKVTFTGATQSQEELLAYSGLAPHKPLSHDQVQAAAQKLGDTGLFGDIQFKYDGTELLFTLTPASGMQPVHYLNFPWWDEASLNAAVAAKVPLFHGMLPADSSLQQAVADALTALVAEKGVHATVTSTPSQDAAGNDAGLQYRIDSPRVEIGAVTLTGASAAWTEAVAAAAKTSSGLDFDGAAETTLNAALRAIYHRQGYLEMAMNGFAVGTPQAAEGKVLVPLSAGIVEGAQYTVASLTLTSASALSAEEFAKAAKLHTGDVANEDLLHDTLGAISAPYQTRGYLKAKIDAAAKLDTAAHTVAYTVTVEPGAVYRMGEISLINLNDQQRAEFTNLWPLREGDVYDATVQRDFLVKNRAGLHSLDGWSAQWKVFEHDDSQIVDLVVTFQKGGLRP